MGNPLIVNSFEFAESQIIFKAQQGLNPTLPPTGYPAHLFHQGHNVR
jgi:hypothetical protein